VPASAPPGTIAPADLCSERAAMLDALLLVCAVVAIVGTAIRIGIAATAPSVRPRRITWDDP
jgi:hypothetical protein